MKDNFDLKKFLTENKVAENSNPYLKQQNLKEENLRKHIREMILKEIAEFNDYEEEVGEYEPTLDDYDSKYAGYESGMGLDSDLYEAKEEETEEETEEEVDITDEEGGEEAPEGEDITGGADLEGVEGEILQSLMDVFTKSKEMGNEDFTNQVSNTVRFLVKIATEPGV